MNAVLLAERLTLLRAIMAAESLVPDAWPRALLARKAGVSPAAYSRLESTGRGSTEVLAAVLHFYQDMGFNLAWVLTPDNADIPVQGFRDIFQDEKLPQARQPLVTLHWLLQPVLAGLDAGQPFPSDALRPLLTQVHEGILHALTHLLPPRRLVLSEADLRAYQRQLPPVSAHTDGWRSAALHAAPRHYYDAGGSLPRCGDPASYLAHDPGPQAGPVATQCGACRDRVNAPVPAGPPARVAPRPRRAAPRDPDDCGGVALRFLRQG